MIKVRPWLCQIGWGRARARRAPARARADAAALLRALAAPMDVLQAELSRLKDADAGGRKIWRKSVTASAAPIPATVPAPAALPVRAAAPTPTVAPVDEVTAALRAAGQPVRLFGETEAQRCARAGVPYTAPAAAPSSSGGSDSGGAASRKRPRQEQEQGQGQEGAGEAYAEEPRLESAGAAGAGGRVRFQEEAAVIPAAGEAPYSSAAPEASTDAAEAAAGEAPPPHAPSHSARKRSHLDALPFAPHLPKGDAHRHLYKFWHGLLCEWEEALAARPAAHAGSAQGRAEAQSASQTREFMTPFFRLCQNRTVPEDMMPLCLEFVSHLLAREYMAAGDAYLRLAVGKAQWLMGVSQVGLHERAARERIYIGKLPHVMCVFFARAPCWRGRFASDPFLSRSPHCHPASLAQE